MSTLKKQPHFIYMKGFTSTSESFTVALDYAKTKDKNKNSILFVFCMHNYFSYSGFRLNSELYSAHSGEKEILLLEGAPVAVLGADEIRFGENHFRDELMEHYNGKILTVVYLLHTTGYDKE